MTHFDFSKCTVFIIYLRHRAYLFAICLEMPKGWSDEVCKLSCDASGVPSPGMMLQDAAMVGCVGLFRS
jgi:hypothetical protein